MPTGTDVSARTLFQRLDLAMDSASAEGASTTGNRGRANAHIHLPPNFSAFDTVGEAVQLAADQGVDVLGASNYYDYQIYGEFAARAAEHGVFPLFGLEIITLDEDLQRNGIKINDPGNHGKMYICGKGISQFDPMNDEAAELLGVIRTKDSERMRLMSNRLAELFKEAGLDTGLDENSVKDSIVARHGSPKSTVYLQERHVAQAFQEALFERLAAGTRAPVLANLFGAAPSSTDDSASVQNGIRAHLMKAGKPAYIPETFVGFDHAYKLVLALGGMPCYPTLIDGASPICDFEAPVGKLIDELKRRNIHCAELIPVRNTPDTLERYVLAMRRAGLVVTAGTEHNTREMLPIEPTCLDGLPIPDAVKEIVWEGACVVAAHQYLTFRGEAGFVDATGMPNSGYVSAEARITAFHRIGASVIRQFRQTFLVR